MKIGLLSILVAVTMVGVASAESGGSIVTLYRNSALDDRMRIHIATFDVVETSPTYNSENCDIAAELFEAQSGVSVRYWCEPGPYRATWE